MREEENLYFITFVSTFYRKGKFDREYTDKNSSEVFSLTKTEVSNVRNIKNAIRDKYKVYDYEGSEYQMGFAKEIKSITKL